MPSAFPICAVRLIPVCAVVLALAVAWVYPVYADNDKDKLRGKPQPAARQIQATVTHVVKATPVPARPKPTNVVGPAPNRQSARPTAASQQRIAPPTPTPRPAQPAQRAPRAQAT